MTIDRTFDFGSAINITHDMIIDFFNRTDTETLEDMKLPVSVERAVADILNGDLDHVTLRRAIENVLETTKPLAV